MKSAIFFLKTSQASKWSTEITARRSFPTWQNLQLNSSRGEKVNSPRASCSPSACALVETIAEQEVRKVFRVRFQRALRARETEKVRHAKAMPVLGNIKFLEKEANVF
jgi:hypothetical protein